MSIHEHSSTTGRNPRTTIAQLFLRAVHRWQQRRTIAALSRLDDRHLDDIGIARNDIPRIARTLVGRAQRGADMRLPAPAASNTDRLLREAA